MPFGREGKTQMQGRESQQKTSSEPACCSLQWQKETLHFLPVYIPLRWSYNFRRRARNYYSQGLFARTPQASTAHREGSKSNKNKG